VIAINYEDCNGCGECVDICPTGAIILQNGKAVLDDVLCEGCQVCIDSCPQGAIICRDPIPVEKEVVRIAESVSRDVIPVESRGVSTRGLVLPAIGSFLLWTGREVLPRLAGLALDYLDRRIQSNGSKDKLVSIQGYDGTPTARRRGSRVRQRQRRGQQFKQ